MKHFKLMFGFSALMMSLLLIACGGDSNEEAASEMGDASSPEMQMEEAPREMMSQDAAMVKLNLNTASRAEFEAAVPPGEMGSAGRMSREFDEYRPYISILQFRQEMGKYVDEEQVAAYEEYVYVPIDRNESDAATLQQIPGLDASEAESVMEGRPYVSNAAFLEAVASYVTEEEQAIAESYLAAG